MFFLQFYNRYTKFAAADDLHQFNAAPPCERPMIDPAENRHYDTQPSLGRCGC